jgi:TPR repeat protein
MRSIGLILLRGEGDVRADPAAAMGWFYEAALRGDALSMRALADGFEQGVGVGRDPALASFWRERAATAHNAQAPRFLRP